MGQTLTFAQYNTKKGSAPGAVWKREKSAR